MQRSGQFSTIQTWDETTLGMVTGNKYFAMPADRAGELGLCSDELLSVSPNPTDYDERWLRTEATDADPHGDGPSGVEAASISLRPQR